MHNCACILLVTVCLYGLFVERAVSYQKRGYVSVKEMAQNVINKNIRQDTRDMERLTKRRRFNVSVPPEVETATTVRLPSYQLYDETELCDAIAKNESLRCLDLNITGMPRHFVRRLASVCKATHLVIQNENYEAELELGETFFKRELQSVELDECSTYLVGHCPSSLRHLGLNLQRYNMETLAKTIIGCTSLQSIKLDFGDGCDFDEVFEALSQIDIVAVHIIGGFTNTFGKESRCINKVKHIHLEETEMHVTYFRDLMLSLRSNTRLETLNLVDIAVYGPEEDMHPNEWDYPVKAFGHYFFDLLKYNVRLQNVRLEYHDIKYHEQFGQLCWINRHLEVPPCGIVEYPRACFGDGVMEMVRMCFQEKLLPLDLENLLVYFLALAQKIQGQLTEDPLSLDACCGLCDNIE